MPAYTAFNDDGFLSQTTDNRIVDASTTVDYLLQNRSGSALEQVGFFEGSDIESITFTRDTGKQEVHESGFYTTLNVDETIHIRVVANAAVADTDRRWRVSEAQTKHGITLKPGVGHTSPYQTVTPGLYLGEV